MKPTDYGHTMAKSLIFAAQIQIPTPNKHVFRILIIIWTLIYDKIRAEIVQLYLTVLEAFTRIWLFWSLDLALCFKKSGIIEFDDRKECQ